MPSRFPPTPEQQAAIDIALSGKPFAVEALAGTGKTSTLEFVAEAMPRSKAGSYVAFNKAIVQEAERRFPRSVKCATAHALAMRAVGREYRHRFDDKKMWGREVATRLGISHIDVPMEGGGAKRLSHGRLGSLVVRTIRAFCMTADTVPTGRHVPRIQGIDHDGTWTNNQLVQDYLAPFIGDFWTDIRNPKGTMPFEHNHYLKMWQLEEPYIDSQFILYDEAQDANPVMLSIVEQQRDHAQLIFVGDRYQQIYSWNGAINAMESAPVEERTYLTQSFRFGPAVAEVANTALRALGATNLVRGFDPIESVCTRIPEPRACLFRTNAGAIGHALNLLFDGRQVAIVGGTGDVVNFARAAADLQDGKGTEHPELWAFNTWQEVKDFVAGEDDGAELKLMVQLMDRFTPKGLIMKLSTCTDERRAEVTVSTAHRSKGREWPSVYLGEDFPVETLEKPLSEEDKRLMYVAATRAQEQLDHFDVTFLRYGPMNRDVLGAPEPEEVESGDE